jgi:hypothetical protein
MRFQVPQFVDIKDKIIGPLTLRQFMIYVFAVMLLIPVYLRSDLSLFLTIAIPTMGLAALFAHFRWHGKSLAQLVSHAVAFMMRGQLFIWRRTGTEKPLKVYLEGSVYRGDSSALVAKARMLETEGSIVKSVDPEALEGSE